MKQRLLVIILVLLFSFGQVLSVAQTTGTPYTTVIGAANFPSITSSAWYTAYAGLLAFRLAECPVARATTYYVARGTTNGGATASDSNDGLDSIGLNFGAGNAVTCAMGGTVLTATGTAFAYTYNAGDYLYLTGGVNVVPGAYLVTGSNGTTTITLSTSPCPNGAGSAITSSTGPWKTCFQVNSAILNSGTAYTATAGTTSTITLSSVAGLAVNNSISIVTSANNNPISSALQITAISGTTVTVAPAMPYAFASGDTFNANGGNIRVRFRRGDTWQDWTTNTGTGTAHNSTYNLSATAGVGSLTCTQVTLTYPPMSDLYPNMSGVYLTGGITTTATGGSTTTITVASATGYAIGQTETVVSSTGGNTVGTVETITGISGTTLTVSPALTHAVANTDTFSNAEPATIMSFDPHSGNVLIFGQAAFTGRTGLKQTANSVSITYAATGQTTVSCGQLTLTGAFPARSDAPAGNTVFNTTGPFTGQWMYLGTDNWKCVGNWNHSTGVVTFISALTATPNANGTNWTMQTALPFAPVFSQPNCTGDDYSDGTSGHTAAASKPHFSAWGWSQVTGAPDTINASAWKLLDGGTSWSPASTGSTTTIIVSSNTGYVVGSTVTCISGANAAAVETITGVSGTTITVTPTMTNPTLATDVWSGQTSGHVYTEFLFSGSHPKGFPAAVRVVNDCVTPITQVNSQSDCDLVAGSFTYDRINGYLYLHEYANCDPNSGPLHEVGWQLPGQEGVVITGVHGTRLRNLWIDGFGMGAPGDTTFSGRGVDAWTTAGGSILLDNCDIYYSDRHNIVTNSMNPTTAGYQGTCYQCTMGWMTGDGIAKVAFNGNPGQQEDVTHQCYFVGGVLPQGRYSPYGNGNTYGGVGGPLDAHTGSSGNYVRLYIDYGSIIKPGQWQFAWMSGTSAAPPLSSNIANCCAWCVGLKFYSRDATAFDQTLPNTYYQGGSANGTYSNAVGMTGLINTSANMCYVNCYVESKALWTPTPANNFTYGAFDNSGAYVINSTFLLDYHNISSTNGLAVRALYGSAQSAGPYTGFYNDLFLWRNGIGGAATDEVYYNQPASGKGATFANCIFALDTPSSPSQGVFKTNIGFSGNLLNNAYYGDTTVESTDPYAVYPNGFTFGSNPLSTSLLLSSHTQSLPGSNVLGLDANLLPRAAPDAIGPLYLFQLPKYISGRTIH